MFNSPLHLPHNKSLIGASDKQDDDRNRLGIELVSSSLIRMRSDKKKQLVLHGVGDVTDLSYSRRIIRSGLRSRPGTKP